VQGFSKRGCFIAPGPQTDRLASTQRDCFWGSSFLFFVFPVSFFSLSQLLSIGSFYWFFLLVLSIGSFYWFFLLVLSSGSFFWFFLGLIGPGA
jgi:hypothetical protein